MDSLFFNYATGIQFLFPADYYHYFLSNLLSSYNLKATEFIRFITHYMISNAIKL